MKLRVLCSMVLLALAAYAQDESALQSKLEAAWKGKVLQLRVFTDDDDISLDSSGKPVSNPKLGSWTTSLLKVQSVTIEGDGLKITGKRFGIKFNGFDSQHQQDLKKKITLHLAKPTGGWPASAEIERLLFVSSKAELQPLVPELWCQYFAPCAGFAAQAATNNPPQKIGGKVSAPKAESTPDPDYSKYAKAVGFQGTCVLWMIVDVDGQAKQIRVVRPIGLGLDEKAADAVSIWKFTPATRDKVPLAVEMNVEVGFHLY
jgi:TonB family protein